MISVAFSAENVFCQDIVVKFGKVKPEKKTKNRKLSSSDW